MRAVHPGTCVACRKHHIRPGDKIQRRLGGYAAERCVEQQDHIRSLTARIGGDMRKRESIVLEHLGANGCRVMESRGMFYGKAREMGYCTLDEYAEMQAYFSGLGLWCGPIDD